MDATSLGPKHLIIMKAAGKPGAFGISDYIEWIVTEPDGPVRFALRMPAIDYPTCRVMSESLQDGYFTFTMEHEDTPFDALLLGSTSDPHPQIPFHENEEAIPSSWGVGLGWVVRDHWTMYSHDFVTIKKIEPPFPIDGIPQVFGRDLLFSGGSFASGSIGAYDDERGFHILVPSKGKDCAGGVRSDGKDIVWTLGEGYEEEATNTWSVRSVITATYTTDPAAIKPRRLRSDPGVIVGPELWGVGCGYGARPIVGTWGLQIVRLSDGIAWHLPKPSGATYGQAIGITCDELFVRVNTNSGANIARVRLDSLGPGLPPD